LAAWLIACFRFHSHCRNRAEAAKTRMNPGVSLCVDARRNTPHARATPVFVRSGVRLIPD